MAAPRPLLVERATVSDRAEREMEWRAIERDARAVALDVLDAEEKTPLEFGAHVAWVYTMYGRTDDLSHVHRVGKPLGDAPYTACHEAIPEAIKRMILTPALLTSIAPCRLCEAEYQRGKRHAA